ncbi:MAG TPA: copper resistance protein CopC [Candidatus Limnocylindria bacterium]|nr:copper resistance protein CopC [Candidatus Limnocylindria bacterium]
MLRSALVALAVIAAVALAGSTALGHAAYVRSNPASDARLVRSPAEVRVTFSEPPDPRGSDVAVLASPAGVRADRGDVRLATDEANTLIVGLPPLAEGGYLVSWTALSTVDGHETRGTFAFVIGSGPLPAIPDVGPASPPPGAVELAGRALSFAGIAFVIGGAFFALFIRRPADEAERRRERRLAIAGGALLAGGTLFVLLSYGATVPDRVRLFLLLRAGAGLVAIGAHTLPMRIDVDTRREIAGFSGLAAGLWATLVSHAAASSEPRFVALDFIHVIAVSVWSGGVLALLVLPLRARLEPAALGATVWRFSLSALVAVAVLVSTGVLQALDRLVLLEDLYETPYGIALLAKVVLLAALLALGALNLLVWGPRLRAGVAARSGLLRGVALETGMFALVLAATAFLTALPPPAQANAAAFDETQRVGGVRIELLMPTTSPGRNRFVVRVTQGLAPVTNAERVALRFTMVEHDMGEQELIATPRAAGEYVAEGSPTAMLGTWKVQAIVRLPGRPDLRALFTVPINDTGGGLAQVVSIPPYNLIVFSDPSQPQAGAPLAVNVVLVDAKGDPVLGQRVSASFSGPAAQTPITAIEDRATLGPGRYRIEIPALQAGTWTLTLAVGSEGSGTYTLEVGR